MAKKTSASTNGAYQEPLELEDNRFGIWGWRLGPAQMTLDGKRTFKNLVHLLMK